MCRVWLNAAAACDMEVAVMRPGRPVQAVMLAGLRTSNEPCCALNRWVCKTVLCRTTTAHINLRQCTPCIHQQRRGELQVAYAAVAEHLVALAPVAPLWLGPVLVGIQYLPGLASLAAHYLAGLDGRSAAAVRTTAAITNIRCWICCVLLCVVA
jgi:hypothetical protein